MWSIIHGLVSPKKFFMLSHTLLPWFGLIFVFLFAYGIIGGLILAPADYLQGDGFRIIYVHAPCAFLSLFIYAIITLAAISHLVWRLKLAPLIIKHSLSLGASFTFLALLTGSLWGKPMWGTWWIWDARLSSELILFFIYLSIILLQSALANKQSGSKVIAILILVGSIDLPIIHYSVNWWNTLHQGATLNVFYPTTIDRSMLYPLLSMILAFFFYYAIVLLLRVNSELIALGNYHWLEKKNARLS